VAHGGSGPARRPLTPDPPGATERRHRLERSKKPFLSVFPPSSPPPSLRRRRPGRSAEAAARAAPPTTGHPSPPGHGGGDRRWSEEEEDDDDQGSGPEGKGRGGERPAVRRLREAPGPHLLCPVLRLSTAGMMVLLFPSFSLAKQ